MISLEKYIDFNKLKPEEFEELCFQLILKSDFVRVTWRRGGPDNGRDIEAYYKTHNNIISEQYEKYFFECKKYEKGVPPSELNSKIAWADAERPKHLVIFVSSYLTNNAREWIEKIKRDKYYSIHILEEKEIISLLLEHEDLISKYFIADKNKKLLTETIEKWLIYNLIPDFYTYYYLLENLDKSSLTTKEVVFLYILYFTHYSKLEELDNKEYHGIDISSDISELNEILVENCNFKDFVLKDIIRIETLSSEGLLGMDEETIDEYNYDFIATEMILHSGLKIDSNSTFKLANYMFRRISDTEFIEILLNQNSSLEYKIHYGNNYTFNTYKNAVNFLDFRESVFSKILGLSIPMKKIKLNKQYEK